MSRAQRNRLLLVAYVLLLLLTVFVVLRFGTTKEPEVMKIGLVMSDRLDGDGKAVYKGVSTACESLGAELLVRDSVPDSDGSCIWAVAELAEAGADMIILSSPGYSAIMEPVFNNYPTIDFYGIFASNVSFDVANLTSYSTRMYQARYLSGIVAGMYSSTGKIGFVAPERSSEVCRNINAFTMGVRRVAPEAEVVVAWANTDSMEKTAAHELIEREGVDVITYHKGQRTVTEAAEEAGVAYICYYERPEGASDKCLTCAACDWSILYEHLIQEYMRGQNNGSVVNEWLGLESGVVGLTDFSPLVSQETRAEAERAREQILSGWDVFTGVIRDDTGTLRCGEGESMTDESLLRCIDWLVEGVRVYE